MTVLSKDTDFKNSHFLQSKPEKLLRIALGNIPTKKLIAILENNFDLILDSFQNEKCFVEIGDNYIEIVK